MLCVCFVTGCSTDRSSFMEEFELPVFGNTEGESDQLLVPPGLVAPETAGQYTLPGSKASARTAALSSLVLPQRFDMRLYREGNTAWLSIGIDPVSLWPHLKAFMEGYGFTLSEENAAHGVLETDWRERIIDDPAVRSLRERNKFRVRMERDANAVTNVYVAGRRLVYARGAWDLGTPDVEMELDLLYDVRDYLAAVQGRKNIRNLKDLENFEMVLDIRDVKGVPALVIGQAYSSTWRLLGVALDRAGFAVRDADRSRGIYLIDYDGEDVGGLARTYGRPGLMQLHLLGTAGRTVVTVHPNRFRGGPVPYEVSYELLRRVIEAYS